MRKLVFRFILLLLLGAANIPSLIAQLPEEQASEQKSLEMKAKDSFGKDPVRNRLVVVGPPKMYDDLYLQSLLTSLQNQLAAVHGIDQTTLLSHIGVAQGADLRQTSVALSASGPPTAQTSTFTLAPGVPAFSYPPGYSSSSGTSSTLPTGTATATTPGTTTTMNSVTPTAPTPPAGSLSVPAISALGQSSLDTYNESLQLSSEIANTALLLNGALDDTLQRSNGIPKTTVTIGFPITIEPPSISDKDLASAVAEVRVAICSNSGDEPPSIVTLLPQERSYNVASMVDKSFLGSASAILGGVVNVGGGFLWSHQRYYLVQQQETVAFLLAPDKAPCGCGGQKTSFAWQVQPVLGKKFIRPGNSVNFVRISVPKLMVGVAPTQPIGQACVSVLWRKAALTGLFRRKSEEYLGETISGKATCYDIDYYNTLGESRNRTLSVTDIGQGAVTVKAIGTFLPGTTVRLGNTYLKPDSITATHDTLTFTTLASAIVAAGQVYIVGRDGREFEAVHAVKSVEALCMEPPTISPYSETQSLVKINFKAPRSSIPGDKGPFFENPADDPWVVVIGGKVFGLSDAPFFSKKENEIQAIIPTALIQTSPRIELRRLLWPDVSYRKSWPIPADTFSKAAPSVSKASVMSTQKGLTIALLGTGLDNLQLVYPSHAACKDCTSEAIGSTFMQVTLPKPPEPKKDASAKKEEEPRKSKKDEPAKKDEPPPDPSDGLRQLVFCRWNDNADRKKYGNEWCDMAFPTLIVDVPKLDTPTPKPKLDKLDPILVNTRQVTITGSMLDQVVAIEHAKVSIPFRLVPVPGKGPSLVVDLPDSIATVPGGYSLLVTFADKSVTGFLVTIQKSVS